jgi:signal transduction histidine kinase
LYPGRAAGRFVVPSSRLFQPHRWPLATKLAAVVFVLAIVPMVVVALFNAQDVEAQAELRERDALERRAAAASRRLPERVGRLRAYVDLLASNPALSDTMGQDSVAEGWSDRHAGLQDLLGSVRAANPWFQNVYLLDARGVCVATSEEAEKPEMVGRSYDYRPYFRQPRASGEPFVSDVLKNANSPGTAIFVSAPLRSGGVAVIKIDTAALHDVVADLAKLGGRVWMVDRFGVIVSDATEDGFRGIGDDDSLQFHSLGDVGRYLAQFEETKRYGEPDGDNYFDRVNESLGLDELWLRLKRNENAAREFAVPPRPGAAGVPTVLGYGPVWSDEEQPYGYVVIGEKSAEFREPLEGITRASLLRIVLAFAGVAVVIAISLRGLSRRVGELADATRRLAAGETSVELTEKPADELGTLAASFNRMSEQLVRSVADLQRQREEAEQARQHAEAAVSRRDAALVRVGHRLRPETQTWEAASAEIADEGRRADARAATRRVQAHADALLAMSGAGLPEAELESFEVTKLLREVVGRAQAAASLSQTTISLEVDNALGRITSDRRRLAAILDEVLANAAVATRHGTIEVRAERDDAHVTITVRDTGVGMTRGQREQVQAPDPSPEGDRLGLHLAWRTATHLQAELSVASVPGEGTTVSLRVPSSLAR